MKNHEKRTNNLINIYFYPCKKHKYIIINNLGKITIESLKFAFLKKLCYNNYHTFKKERLKVFIIDKKIKIISLVILLMLLTTRYVFLVNQEKSVNKVLIAYASSFETANILEEIDSAGETIKSSSEVIKIAQEEEKRKKEEEEKKRKEEEAKKKKEEVRTKSIVSDTSTNTGLASEIVNYAMQFVGNPYVYGGNSLTTGTDCSGFTSLVFKHFGITLDRTAAGQAYNGREVSLSDIRPGDLVLHGYDGVIIHAALYIGNNQVVHALNENTGIIVTDYQIMPIISVRRVL